MFQTLWKVKLKNKKPYLLFKFLSFTIYLLTHIPKKHILTHLLVYFKHFDPPRQNQPTPKRASAGFMYRRSGRTWNSVKKHALLRMFLAVTEGFFKAKVWDDRKMLWKNQEKVLPPAPRERVEPLHGQTRSFFKSNSWLKFLSLIYNKIKVNLKFILTLLKYFVKI